MPPVEPAGLFVRRAERDYRASGLPCALAGPSTGDRGPGSGPAFGEPGIYAKQKFVYPLVAMPRVATEDELLELAHDLFALRAELAIASTTTEIDMLVERYFEMGVFHRLRPSGRQLLGEIISRRMREVEVTEACGDSTTAMAEYDEHARMLAMAREMSR